MILDTNALSAWAEGLPAVEPALRAAHRLVVPCIVLGEYYSIDTPRASGSSTSAPGRQRECVIRRRVAATLTPMQDMKISDTASDEARMPESTQLLRSGNRATISAGPVAAIQPSNVTRNAVSGAFASPKTMAVPSRSRL